jgi:endonuclease YncB( thermonuclease family)
VVDGDTIWVELNREREKVRYIGIDAPETNHPIKGVQEYGAEAKAANRNSWRARSYGWSSMWGGGPGVGGTDASRWKPRNLSTSPISDIEKL